MGKRRLVKKKPPIVSDDVHRSKQGSSRPKVASQPIAAAPKRPAIAARNGKKRAGVSDHTLAGSGEVGGFIDVLESMTDGFMSLDQQWRITYVNAAAEVIHGMTRATLLGKILWDAFPDALSTEFERLLRRAMIERDSLRDTSFCGPFGGWLEREIHPLKGGGLALFGRDITTRKQDEETLSRLQQERNDLLARLQRRFDRMPFACVIMDASYHVIDWNPAAEKVFAYRKDEIVGKHCHILVPPMVRQGLADVERRLVAGDMEAHVVTENVTKDGRVILCEWHNTPLMTDGQVVAILAIVTDITEQRRTQDRLRESEEKLRTLADNVPSLIWACTPEKQVDYVSPQLTQYTGVPNSELLGSWHLDLIHPDDHESLFAAWARSVSEEAQSVFEVRIRRHDGAWRWFQVRTSPLRDSQGRVVKWFCANTDIDDLKRAEDGLREYTKALHRLSRRVIDVQEEERRHLARELHDEIGQVLCTISMNLKSSENERAAAGPRMEESIQIVDNAIEQVRNLSLNLRPSMLDDLGLIATIRWYADRHAQRSGVALEINADASLDHLPPDLAIVAFRVVQEALTNVARHAKASHVWIDLQRSEDEVRLVIRDDGIGFDVATVREGIKRGACLGVLGIQERVALFGGQLDIESQPSHGTAIHVRFSMASVPSQL